KIAVDAGVPPAFVAWARVALGAALLLPIALHRGALRGLQGRGGAITAYTATEIAIPFVLIAVGERYVSSSLAAILVATMPLLLALLSVRVSPADRPTGRRVMGLVIGLGGVVAVLGLVVFFQLIAAAGASRASIITYVNPLVAVIIGVLALHEHVGTMSLAGLFLILAGSWLAAGGRRPGEAAG